MDEQTNNSAESVLDPVEKINILDKAVDKSFEKIISYLNTKDETLMNSVNSINLKDLASSIKKPDAGSESLEQKLKDKETGIGDDILSQIGNLAIPKERSERYKQYSHLPYELYLATRMTQVYLDNILIKNPYTKQFLEIMNSEQLDNDTSVTESDKNVLTKFAKTVFAYFDIQKRLKNDILPKQLTLGNFFIEVVNLNKYKDIEDQSGSMKIITEASGVNNDYIYETRDPDSDFTVEFDLKELYYEHIVEESSQSAVSPDSDFDRQIQQLMKDSLSSISSESVVLFEDAGEQTNVETIIDDIRSLDLSLMKYINLRYISPESVIILEKNGNSYGYLVIEGQDKSKSYANANPTGDTYNILGRTRDLFERNQGKSSVENNPEDVIDNVIKSIFKKIRSKNNISKITELIDIVDDTSIHALKSLLIDLYQQHAKIKIRYVSNEDMVNYTNPIDKYAPYGTSIFDTVLFPARLYMLGLLSSIVSRLNRASVVRKWVIEAGSHRNHAEIIEKFKRELRNQTISFEDVMKLKDINQTVSDYKDFVTISQDGKRFVDLEIMPMHDRSLPMNETESLKQDVIAASGIPSAMLGITDTYDLREQIVNVNIIFATKIDTFQTFVNEANEDLVNTVLRQLFNLNGKLDLYRPISRYIDIKLNPPLVLVLQHLESTLSSATNIINLLKGADIPTDPTWILKRFIKIINWDALKTAGEKYINDQQTNQAIQNDIQQSMQSNQGGGSMY